MSKPSYMRHAGQISHTWKESGSYGEFINSCRIEAWRQAIKSCGIDTSEVLDFGCANGSWAENWKTLGFKKTSGIDINPDVVTEAAKHLDRVSIGGTKELFEASARTIGCNSVLVHILESSEVRAVFRAAFSALSKGGHFVAAILNPSYYVTTAGFQAWDGPLSCTRDLQFHEVAATDAGFKIESRIGTFINPWFCPETVFIANSDVLKADKRLFDSFSTLSDTIRDSDDIRLFSELLLICKRDH